MAPTKPAMASNHGQVNPAVGPHARVAKKTCKKRRRKDGLLNASIPCNSGHLLEIAQQNSIRSPLLRLPGEIRNKIWKLAVGGHVIGISIQYRNRHILRAVLDNRLPGSRNFHPFDYIYPTFQLPLVCRQMYVETSAYIYSHNTFHFLKAPAVSTWTKKRFPGQRALITSIDVPWNYMQQYCQNSSRLRETFGGLTRVGVDADVHERRMFSIQGGDTLENQAEIVRTIKQNEGEDIVVDWYQSPYEDD